MDGNPLEEKNVEFPFMNMHKWQSFTEVIQNLHQERIFYANNN